LDTTVNVADVLPLDSSIKFQKEDNTDGLSMSCFQLYDEVLSVAQMMAMELCPNIQGISLGL